MHKAESYLVNVFQSCFKRNTGWTIMLYQAFALFIILPLITGYPQYSPGRYEVDPTAAAYTDSPDAKLISLNAENQPEKPSPRPVNKVYRSGVRQQQQYRPQPQVLPQPSYPQPVPQEQVQYQEPQQYESQYVHPAPKPVHVQPVPQQYESQYVQPAQPKHVHSQPAAPTNHENRHSTTTYIPILKFDKSQALDGSYKQSWETGNNIIVEETGFLKNSEIKDEPAIFVQQGSYTYTAPDGTIITTTYTADEGGFHVEGSHLPTAPPIPAEIQKGLDQIYEGIRLQQEEDAVQVKAGGKVKPQSGQYEENSVSSDNYPQQHQQQQYQQQYQQQQQLQHQEQQTARQYQKQQQQQQKEQQTARQYQQAFRKSQRQEDSQQYEQQQQQ